jgi:6-pyruvoyltetrahydropterin/6-carboxytetrahydropterin synthase
VRLTRRYRFSASHRLDLASLSAGENQRLFGKCNNPFGHGHDYTIDVTVEGWPGETGQLVNRAALDSFVRERILDRLDHKDLNRDVPELSGKVPTTENLAVAVRDSLARDWSLPARLARVRISETERNIFELEA